jgi:ATP-dependent helicase Lhr and Lhr-like helicase
MLADRPDILLTTPESIEAMLVSRRVDHERFLRSVQAVVIDELHGAVAQSFEVCQAKREVLLGAVPDVELSKRVPVTMERLREERASEVSDNGLVLHPRGAEGARLWTWAGLKANATLLAGLGLNASGVENESVLLPEGITADDVKAADSDAVPRVDEEVISGLKFSVALPSDLAVRTLGERLADQRGAGETAQARIVQYRAW